MSGGNADSDLLPVGAAERSTAEILSNEKEAELQRRLAERQEEISHMQEILETKVQLLQKEAEVARDKAQQMASLADSEAQRCLALEREMVEMMEENGDLGRLHSQKTLTDKDRLIEDLKQQKHSLGLRVEQLQVKVHHLSSLLKNREREAELSLGCAPAPLRKINSGCKAGKGDKCGSSGVLRWSMCSQSGKQITPLPRCENRRSAQSAAGSAVIGGRDRSRVTGSGTSEPWESRIFPAGQTSGCGSGEMPLSEDLKRQEPERCVASLSRTQNLI
ncbi:hypothetical protein CRENBAI_008117 [Crenichthys baileyi]|uniref:Uncharacterized protein n=1 Tax=Crenichthys baileyi TaxID=28760 RepID=A0AAV9R7A8_9TELE